MALPTTEFTAHQTSIPGLLVFDITSIVDERGWFQEKYQQQKLVASGLPPDFRVVQTNVSHNQEKGVARGFHAEPWQKYISVVSGRAFVAYVDLRSGPGFGRVEYLEVDNNKSVYVPLGVANSFQTLEEDTYYIYSVSDYWRQDHYDRYPSVNMADPDLKINWPIPLKQANISEHDRSLPMLKDTKPILL